MLLLLRCYLTVTGCCRAFNASVGGCCRSFNGHCFTFNASVGGCCLLLLLLLLGSLLLRLLLNNLGVRLIGFIGHLRIPPLA